MSATGATKKALATAKRHRGLSQPVPRETRHEPPASAGAYDIRDRKPCQAGLPRHSRTTHTVGSPDASGVTGTWHPLSVLQAMAHDVVVIASDIEPNSDLVGTAQVAGSEAAGIELLRAALTDPARREEMLAEQRRRRTAFGRERMVSDWLGLYSSLASEDSGGG